jgi:ketosteroid isomerase-like protein/SAM-dependent methyltransferase
MKEIVMTTINRYATSWESFWGSTTGTAGEVFWDADPIHASQQDLALFREYFDPRLPLIDLGCGNGTQARFLANHFKSVIGTEIAPAAVSLARKTNGAANITYRLLDMLHPDKAQRLHDDIGDANLYMRAVLHQLSPTDHATAVQSIERLLGATGTLYLIELSSAAEPYFARLIQQYGPPPGLARVFQHQITPGMLHERDLQSLFPPNRFTLLATGSSQIRTVHTLPTDEVVEVPAFYAILRRQEGGVYERRVIKQGMAIGHEKELFIDTPGPLDVVTKLVMAMNACDLESALTLFESGASFVMKPGVVVHGTAGIREALEGFMALKPTLTINAQQILLAGDIAQYCARWSIKGIDPKGIPLQLGGRSSSILRRQPDGRWLFLVDNPWGTDIVE